MITCFAVEHQRGLESPPWRSLERLDGPQFPRTPASGSELAENDSPAHRQFAAFDRNPGDLAAATVLLCPSFAVATGIVNGIHAIPNQISGREGSARGERFSWTSHLARLLPSRQISLSFGNSGVTPDLLLRIGAEVLRRS
jgi:hypothetical protein